MMVLCTDAHSSVAHTYVDKSLTKIFSLSIMAAFILTGTPAVIATPPLSAITSITADGTTLTGNINLAGSGGASIGVAGQTITVDAIPTPVLQAATALNPAGLIGFGMQNILLNTESGLIPLTWGATLADILDPAGPAPPAGSIVQLDLAGLGFYVPTGGSGSIEAQLTNNAGIDYPVLTPLVKVTNAVAAATVGLQDLFIDAVGLHNSGMPVSANNVYLRITNLTGQSINLVALPDDFATTYWPEQAP
jgi:hypothetical protein